VAYIVIHGSTKELVHEHQASILGVLGCLGALLAACSSEVADDGAASGEAVVASRAAGSRCGNPYDCGPDLYCTSDMRCAKLPSLANGASGCVKAGEDTRVGGKVCKSGICDPTTDACVASAEGLGCAKLECPSGLVCRPTLASAVQGKAYHKEFCVKPGQVGDRCGLSADRTKGNPDNQCAPGLICNLEAPVCGNGVCEQNRKTKEVWRFWTGSVTNPYDCRQDCYGGMGDDPPLVFTMGFCAAPASVPEGQPCDSDKVCAQGLICPDPGAPNAGRCTAP
jgi:hypothetical protein